MKFRIEGKLTEEAQAAIVREVYLQKCIVAQLWLALSAAGHSEDYLTELWAKICEVLDKNINESNGTEVLHTEDYVQGVKNAYEKFEESREEALTDEPEKPILYDMADLLIELSGKG